MPNQLTQQMENLYKASSERWEVGDRIQFLQSMSDPAKQKTLYDSLSVDFDLGTFEEYSTIVNQSILELPTEHRDITADAQPISDPVRDILTPETAKIYDAMKQQVTPDETVSSIEAATPPTEQPIEQGVQKEEPIKPYQIDPQADFGTQVRDASKETLRRITENVRLETFTDIPEALSKALPEYGENLQKESNDAFIDAWEPLLEALDPKREEPLGKRLGKEGALFAIMAPVIVTSMLDDPVKTTKGIAEFFLSIINDWIVATRLTTHPAYDAKESEEARAEIQRTPLFHTVPLLGVGAAFKSKIGKMKPEAAKTLSETLAKDVVKEAHKELGKPFKEFPEDISVTSKLRAEESIKKAEIERQKTIPEESKVTPKPPKVEPPEQVEIELTRKINEGLKDAELAIKPTKKPAADEADIKTEPVIEEPTAVAKTEEKVEPVKPIEKAVEKPIEIAEKPAEPKITPKKTETPVETKVEGKEGEPRQVITVAEIEKSRIKAGLSKLPKEEAQKWVDVLKGAEKRTDAVAIAESIRKKPRVLTNEEVLTLGLEKERIENLIDSSQKEISRAIDSGNKVEKSRHTDVQSNALVELDKITDAIRFHSRESGRALQFHRIALEREGELYKVASILQRAKVAKGERLTEIESNALGSLGRKIDAMSKKEAKLTKEIEALQEILSKRDAKAEFVRTTKRIPRERTQAALKKERADLFADLNKVGYRLNDVIGLTYESATIVGKLAKNYFESGIKDLDAIVEKIQTKVPDMSKKDVYDSIGGRIKKTKKIVENTAKQELADLRKEAKLMGQIEDAYKGVFDAAKKHKLAPRKIVDLQKKLAALKKQANKTVKDDAKLNQILLRIDNAKALLASGQRAAKQKPKTVDPSIARAQKELSELRRLLTTKDKIADLEHQLRTGDFKVPVKTRTVIANADLIDAQVELTKLRREVRDRIHAMTPLTTGQKAIEWVTLPRTLMSMADVSMIARQGLAISARHPIQTAKFLPSSIQSFFSQNKADQIDVWIRKHPNQPTREQAGLFLSSIEKPLNTREEFFSSNLAERIPVWGKMAKASNRHAVTHLNFMRVASFDQFLKNYPNATNVELKTWARLVNIMSGRGDLGTFNKNANALSVVFFSPRFSVSRIQLPFEVLRPSNLKHPSVRKEMAKSIGSYLGLVGTVLFLADMAGMDVGTDPNSPDWLKIRDGDTRIDIFGGYLQSTRVLALAGLTALETRGFDFEGDRDFRSAVERFERYKQSPPVTMTFEFITGKTSVGEETTPLGTIRRAVTPFAFQDIVDTFKSEPKLLPIIAPLALSGVGINTYRERFGIKRLKL